MEWLWAHDYWLSRLVFQRGLAVIYLLAFLGALNQFRALIGERGLLPAPVYIRATPFRDSPSLFQLRYSDRLFAAVAVIGILTSLVHVVGALDGVPLGLYMASWALLWVLYVSIVNIGQTWYAFGWELLLCEAGFLAIFLGNDNAAPPTLILLALIWVLFRLEFGAGLIKLRGDACWRDLTCLYYHHETQPMPGPLSWYFHRLPKVLHRVEVAANHFTQLIVPFLLFAPQPVRGVAAAIVIVTQLWLVASGNFAWLNVVAIVIATSALGDDIIEAMLPVEAPATSPEPGWLLGVTIAISAVIVFLSYWPVRNLIGSRQLMNYSFTPIHLVNTYGAFGSITKVRHEVVIEGTAAGQTDDGATEWREYEFKGKPGDVTRRPPQVAPYHLRLDWMMWFAALSRGYSQRWLPALLDRLLVNDRAMLRLLRTNPFPNEPPVRVRARLYRYRFTTRAERRATGSWWHRTLVGEYAPPRSRTSVRQEDNGALLR
ncbi:MAG TPA: lipase maturation factor family protein [Jiangellaceae bacterium]